MKNLTLRHKAMIIVAIIIILSYLHIISTIK